MGKFFASQSDHNFSIIGAHYIIQVYPLNSKKLIIKKQGRKITTKTALMMILIQTTGRYSCSRDQLNIIPLRNMGKVAYSSIHAYRQY